MAYNIFIRSLLRDEPLTICGDGEQSRSNTFIDDCVRGTIKALEDAKEGEIYNIGGGEKITINQSIDIIASALGVRPRVVYEAPRAGDQRHTFADTKKASSEFGYQARVTPEEGLRAQVEWQCVNWNLRSSS
jgi:UDP-glucuronate 4-epimerase